MRLLCVIPECIYQESKQWEETLLWFPIKRRNKNLDYR